MEKLKLNWDQIGQYRLQGWYVLAIGEIDTLEMKKKSTCYLARNIDELKQVNIKNKKSQILKPLTKSTYKVKASELKTSPGLPY